MPNQKTPKPEPLYRRKPRARKGDAGSREREEASFHPLAPAPFVLREDWTVRKLEPGRQKPSASGDPGNNPALPLTESPAGASDDSPGQSESASAALGSVHQTIPPLVPKPREARIRGAAKHPPNTPVQADHGPRTTDSGLGTVPRLILSHDSPFIRLYHADCFQLLDAIAAKYPEGRFDAIFADPPYFLSNGGITCHAGRMVKVDKGEWDKSRGPELNHEFNREWLRRCRRVLKPNGTIWVSGTHHVIFSIGYAMQQLGFKILNGIAWEKPNPPPNLSCRYFTHSTETILWAARDEKSKHVFNYSAMRAVTGKQMKTVWRDVKTEVREQWPEVRPLPSDNRNAPGTNHGRAATAIPSPGGEGQGLSRRSIAKADEGGHEPVRQAKPPDLHPPPSDIWTLSAPGTEEKAHGKHPTQKPVALIERCLLASTNPGDLVLDPFLGGGTTAIAALKLNRGCVGIETDFVHIALAAKRADHAIIALWLRHFRVTVSVTAFVRAKPFENPERIPSFSPALTVKRAAPGQSANNPLNPAGVGSNVRKSTAGPFLPPDSPQIDLDLFPNSINGSRVDDKPQMPAERIFHETKFVFLSCAEVERGAVVHTTVDVSLQEAWAKTPTGKKRETTHIVRCETEILRVKSGV